MKPGHRLLTLVIPTFCALMVAGCSQEDGLHGLTAPSLEAPAGTSSSLGMARDALSLSDQSKEREIVQEILGPEGGVIETKRISVLFPKGSLPFKTEITLVVWGADEVYFTVEPRDLVPLVPVQFSFKVESGKGSDLSYFWNDNGWREPLPCWLNKDGTILLSEADFLGEFLVAPEFDGKGRAGW
jgi:hypothetical protein